MAGAGDTDSPGGSRSDQAIDAIVERGDERKRAGRIRRGAAASAVNRGQERGGDGVVDDISVAQHDGVGSQPATDRLPHLATPGIVRGHRLNRIHESAAVCTDIPLSRESSSG
jgi:hypothetical protein